MHYAHFFSSFWLHAVAENTPQKSSPQRQPMSPLPVPFLRVDGSVIVNDSTRRGDHSSGPMRNRKLT